LDLKLAGSPEAIQQAVGPEVGTPTPSPDGMYHVQIRLPDQMAADQCVDRLRQGGVSIVSLAPRRISLEDGFMDLLNQAMVVPDVVE
jgi:hypothetical protein